MRIAIINQFYRPDISPTAALSTSLAEGLTAAGHTVTVVTSQGGYVEASRAETKIDDNPRVYRIWTPRLGKKTIVKRCIDYATFYLLAAWRMVRLPRQDAIIALTTPPYIVWTAIFHRWLHRSTKLVLWNMDCYPDVAERAGVIRKGGLLSRLLRAVNRAMFRRLDHLVCLDQAMVDLMVPQYAPPRGLPATVIPNWEPASFFPADLTPPEWPDAASLGLQGKFVVLYMGNAGVGHRFETLVEAAKLLRDEPVVFLFAGGGRRWRWLQDAKAREGLTNLILRDYVGAKELTASAMAASDCALITLDEAMLGVMSPSKLHANLAMGLPILYIGPPTSNVDEAIQRFGCGASLRQGDAADVVAFIRKLMADPAELQRLQRHARQAFEQAYCDQQTLPQFERLLTSLVAPQANARPTQAATSPS